MLSDERREVSDGEAPYVWADIARTLSKKDSRPDPFYACRDVHLVNGAVLSFLIVEPHKPEGPDRPDEPVPATRREMLDRMTLPFGLKSLRPCEEQTPLSVLIDEQMARPSPIELGCRVIPPDPSGVCRWPHA
jgi:hypothetical protein